MKARFIATYKGKRYYRVPVVIRCNDIVRCLTVAEYKTTVLARNATEAANYVRDEWAHRPETEVFAYGPKGGEVMRYVGWYSCIGNALLGNGGHVPDQLTLGGLI